MGECSVRFGIGFRITGQFICVALASCGAIASDSAVQANRGTSSPFGDRDMNGKIDLFDAAGFQICFSGPGPVTLGAACNAYDHEPDGDVDLADYAVFRDAGHFSLSYNLPETACSFDNVNCDGQAQIPFTLYRPLPDSLLDIQLILDIDADGSDDGNVAVFADSDGDFDIDLRDAADFQRCFDGSFSLPAPCRVFDFDGNNRLNLNDYREFNRVFGLGETALLTIAETPIGNHALRVRVNHPNGYELDETIPFTVADCKAPSPICISSLSIDIFPLPPDSDADGDGDIDSGAMKIFASDFIASEINDCSGPIDYSISRPEDTPDVEQTGLVLTCDDGDFAMIRVYAWDQAVNPTTGKRNYDFCEVFLSIEDKFDVCAP